MRTSSGAQDSGLRRPAARSAVRPLAAVAAGALLVSAWVHVDLAESPYYADDQVTLSGLFLAQAVVAALVAGWLLARPDVPALLVGALVGTGSFLALVVTVYAEVPSLGPFPSVHEPVWYAEKVVAALAAGLAATACGAALASRSR